jgi:hypothetical protein
MDELCQSFPKVQLDVFQKTSSLSGVGLLLPKGPKAFAWFTRLRQTPICILLPIDGNEIQKATHIYVSFKESLAEGTILYGTYSQRQFVIENIYYEKGRQVYLSYLEKLGRIKSILEQIHPCVSKESVPFYLPKMVQSKYLLEASNMPYPVYGILTTHGQLFILMSHLCTFLAKRKEEMEDVYELYALQDTVLTFYTTALINDFKTSHQMKQRAFKNKPNYRNVELSDSEEEECLGDFCVQCLFIPEFKRWKPLAYKSLPLSTVREVKIKERAFYK